MTMETRGCKLFFPNDSKNKSTEDTRTAAMGKTENIYIFSILFFHAAARGGTCAFMFKTVNTLIKNSSRDDRPVDLDIESTHGQPTSCRARPMRVDDGLEDIRWIRGLGGANLPAAFYTLLPILKILFAV